MGWRTYSTGWNKIGLCFFLSEVQKPTGLGFRVRVRPRPCQLPVHGMVLQLQQQVRVPGGRRGWWPAQGCLPANSGPCFPGSRPSEHTSLPRGRPATTVSSRCGKCAFVCCFWAVCFRCVHGSLTGVGQKAGRIRVASALSTIVPVVSTETQAEELTQPRHIGCRPTGCPVRPPVDRISGRPKRLLCSVAFLY